MKAVYVLNADIPKLLENAGARKKLKQPEFARVFVLPQDYADVLFNHVQASTALAQFGGELQDEVFALGPLLGDKLGRHFKLQS